MISTLSHIEESSQTSLSLKAKQKENHNDDQIHMQNHRGMKIQKEIHIDNEMHLSDETPIGFFWLQERR